jgi:hypothetical protein
VPAIDRFLPRFDVSELHACALPVPPERAIEAVLATPVVPDAVVGALFSLRGLRGSRSIEAALRGIGFQVLERTPTEVVLGAAGKPWRPRGGLVSFASPPPGTVRIAADFRAEPRPGGCVLFTETRIAATDDAALRAFRRYWLLVGPFSALIRRRWLAAVSRRLARESEPQPR